MTWLEHVRADPLPWLLAEDTPPVRAATLQRLLDAPADAPEVCRARRAAMDADPIKAVLAAQDRRRAAAGRNLRRRPPYRHRRTPPSCEPPRLQQ
jgi:hypothetical protein